MVKIRLLNGVLSINELSVHFIAFNECIKDWHMDFLKALSLMLNELIKEPSLFEQFHDVSDALGIVVNRRAEIRIDWPCFTHQGLEFSLCLLVSLEVGISSLDE